ncbi:RNA polymerase sigma factor SigL [Luteitalea pratensis]|uniref:RNA polymerase sigma factor SigL n=1 Tax=Luteitalea pratensis TaxID=1855912 RepID=A0A143PLT4_LUTPR|nr:ECF-type sigma factor [Luteitalea pratensis]AMY09451.1 RNA polymerase sigma factor SigL [Luteitalea pratensis]
MQVRERGHFVAMAATMMRRLLVDHARAYMRDQCGGGVPVTSLHDDVVVSQDTVDIVAMDVAPEQLVRLDEQQARVVGLRFFGGIAVEETADVLDISPRTVKRVWAICESWLHKALTG